MRVILDGVFNHSGRGFWPFHHVLELGEPHPTATGSISTPPSSRARSSSTLTRTGVACRDATRSATGPGGTAAPLPSLGLPAGQPRGRVSTSWGSASIGLRFGIDGWRLDVPAEIDDRAFWAEFRRRCRAVDPEAYIVGEMWDIAQEWVEGDRFDALMNYPLGTAILGFVGGGHLNMDVIQRHDSYRRMIQPLDGPSFARRLEALMTNYDPAVVAVRGSLIGSHDTPWALTVSADRATLPAGYAPPDDPARRAVRLLRRRDRDGRRPRSRQPNQRFIRPIPGPAIRRSGPSFGRIEPRHEQVALRRGSFQVLSAAGGAVAYLREAEGARAIVAINAGPTAARLAVPRAGNCEYRQLEFPGLPRGSRAEGTIDLATRERRRPRGRPDRAERLSRPLTIGSRPSWSPAG